MISVWGISAPLPSTATTLARYHSPGPVGGMSNYVAPVWF